MSDNIKVKDPNERLDYKFDFASATNGGSKPDYLQPGETITLINFINIDQPEMVIESSSITDLGTSVTYWLSAGTLGVDYLIQCNITTSVGGRIVDRNMVIQCRDR